MQALKQIRNCLPFLYFAGIAMWIGLPKLISGDLSSLIPVAIGTGFIALCIIQRNSLNLLIGILMFFWSILILFAYLSDASKLDSADLSSLEISDFWRLNQCTELFDVLSHS